MPDAISSRTSPQMPSDLGAANAWSWTALSRSTTVAATIDSPATSTRSSMPSTPGTNSAAEVHPALAGLADLAHVPRAVRPRGGRKVVPGRLVGAVRLRGVLGRVVRAFGLVDLVDGVFALLATTEHGHCPSRSLTTDAYPLLDVPAVGVSTAA